MKKLCELQWFRDIYRRIYEVLSSENALPDPCGIIVFDPDEVTAPETVYGLAFRAEKSLWFRQHPPDCITFAHELLHLIEFPGKTRELEELYGYNLASLAVMFAEEGVVPRINIVRLFSDVSEEDILEALKKVYRYEFKSLEEFFETIGVIPMFMEIKVEDMEIKLERAWKNQRLIAIHAITELIAGAEYNQKMLEVLKELLKIVEEKLHRDREKRVGISL